MVPWWLPVDLPNISANTDRLEMWLVLIERSFQGLFVAIETVKIDEELMEIWPNEVCDKWWVHFEMATKNIVMKFLWWNEDEMETSNGASYWRNPKLASNCTLRQGGQGNDSLILTSDVTQCGRRLRDKTKKTAIYTKAWMSSELTHFNKN